ncbi:putative hydrolase YdeN [Bacillus paralicheniformis]|nr:putative hydrolase YdeN [Bacillus paralicheniformis]
MTKQIYIIHGYRASSTNHWFPWLKKRLLADGIHADVLDMPDPHQPRLKDWVDTLSLNKHTLNEHTYLVAHSLGCAAVLRFLEQTQLQQPLGGILLVSGFAKSLPDLKKLDEFTEESFDFQNIISQLSIVLSLPLETIKLCHLHGATIWRNKLTLSFTKFNTGGTF